MKTAFEQCVSEILHQPEAVEKWLQEQESGERLPFYTSVDVRDAGFKAAVVDTNLFPAGFNNLCLSGLERAAEYLKEAISERVGSCKHILLITEEHTRNTWYLENVYRISSIIQRAGFEVTVSTFLQSFASNSGEIPIQVTLETAEGNELKLCSLEKILSNLDCPRNKFDLVIMNNDLTSGAPQALSDLDLPIYPSIQAGWHARMKSHHFREVQHVHKAFADAFSFDPWFISTLYKTSKDVSINEEPDRQALKHLAGDLMDEIADKYREYGITEKPFLFLKSDRGTYGMGVMPIEKPEDILDLNRKARNQLSKGKSAKVIDRFILQEGIPSARTVDSLSSEICVYQITNHFVGGFYRVNDAKSDRENLNSRGMSFRKLCDNPDREGGCLLKLESDPATQANCGLEHPTYLAFYKLLARLAGLAAHREVTQLEDCAEKRAAGLITGDCP